MARGDYGPEIRQSIASPTPRKSVPQRRPGAGGQKPDSPAEMAADKAAGIKQNSPQDIAMDAKMGGAPKPMLPPGPPPMPPGGGGGINPAHAGMAAGIAHAILAGGR